MEDGVGLKLMWLQAVSHQELPEEVTDRQPEAPLKMRQEHDAFTFFWIRLHLITGYAAYHARRDPAARIEPVNIFTRNIRGAFSAPPRNVIGDVIGDVIGIQIIIRLGVCSRHVDTAGRAG